MPTPEAEALVEMGGVLRPHGVRGELKIVPETDDPGRFEALDTLYLGRSADAVTAYTVTSVRHQQTKKGPLVLTRLDGVDGREAAERLKGATVYALLDALPVSDDEVFLHDLVGLAVETDTGEPVGTVRDILDTPANPVYVVARPGKADAMIPGVPAFIDELNPEDGRIIIRPIEGLLD